MKERRPFSKKAALIDSLVFKKVSAPTLQAGPLSLFLHPSNDQPSSVGFVLPRKLISLATSRNKIKRATHECVRFLDLKQQHLVLKARRKIEKEHLDAVLCSLTQALKSLFN